MLNEVKVRVANENHLRVHALSTHRSPTPPTPTKRSDSRLRPKNAIVEGLSEAGSHAIELQTFNSSPQKRNSDLNRARRREERRAQKQEQKRRELRRREEMKFSHSIQFNAVPDWSSHYISYSNLKKLYGFRPALARVSLKRPSPTLPDRLTEP